MSSELTAQVFGEEEERAREIGFMARVFVQATLPHRCVNDNEYTRQNGDLRVTLQAPREIGIPWGSVPRLVLSFLTTTAVRTKDPHIELGTSLSKFMEQLGLAPTGGRWGSIPRLKKQVDSLFGSTIRVWSITNERSRIAPPLYIGSADLWWKAREPDQETLFPSFVDLSPDFFREVTTRPVPVIMDTLKQLKRSPLALDLYVWLTFRMSFLRAPQAISWEALQLQFGAGYPMTQRGKLDFKRAFKREAKKVLSVYPAARIKAERGALILRPSPPHVARR